VRTYQELVSITPEYAGYRADVFPGGCVRYEFRFERGPHIALMDELQQAVALRARQEVRQELRRELDVELEP
jgi:hypothetical protein